MSHLMFTSKCTKEPIAIGYGDAGRRIGETEKFLYGAGE
jgi:hypothetical protein